MRLSDSLMVTQISALIDSSVVGEGLGWFLLLIQDNQIGETYVCTEAHTHAGG